MALSSTEEAQLRALIAQQAAILSLASSESTIISKLAATKVSLADLTAATSLSGADLFLVRQGTTEKSAALSVLTPDATLTAKGLVELATAAETVAGVDAVRAVTPSGLMSGFVSSLTASGYQKLPSGLIIQWGRASVNASTTLTVTLPIAFTNSGLQVFVSDYVNGTGISYAPSATILSTTQINISNWDTSTASISWMTIGY